MLRLVCALLSLTGALLPFTLSFFRVFFFFLLSVFVACASVFAGHAAVCGCSAAIYGDDASVYGSNADMGHVLTWTRAGSVEGPHAERRESASGRGHIPPTSTSLPRNRTANPFLSPICARNAVACI